MVFSFSNIRIFVERQIQYFNNGFSNRFDIDFFVAMVFPAKEIFQFSVFYIFLIESK